MVFLMCGKFDETGHFGIRLFHDEVIRLLPLLCLILFFRINSYGQIEAVVDVYKRQLLLYACMRVEVVFSSGIEVSVVVVFIVTAFLLDYSFRL